MSEKNMRNGAFCNQYGSIYLRVASLDTDAPGWPMSVVDHGISIAEAHCIMSELVLAIHEASLHQTGRIPEMEKEGAK